MKKFLIGVTIFTLLFGCRHQSSDKGPYNLPTLTKLKSSEESLYLSSTHKKTYHLWLVESRYISIDVCYDIQQKDYVLDAIDDTHKYGYTDDEEKQMEEFISDYYFITKEKLETLFPPQYVRASHQWLLGGNRYMLKLYGSESDIRNENSRDFSYEYVNGYLFLVRYDSNRILGRDVTSCVTRFEK